jgi:hypothetical protein
VHLDSDQLRLEFLTKLDTYLNKAIEDKNIIIVQAIIKEVHLIYREFNDKRVQVENFEAYSYFTN